MIKILFIFIIAIDLFSMCNLPKKDIKLFLLSNKNEINGYNSYKKHYNLILSKLISSKFIIMNNNNNDDDEIIIYFEQLENKIFSNTSSASFKITNPIDNSFIISEVEAPFDTSDIRFSTDVVKKITEIITRTHCKKFQSIFDKQIALEKQQSFKYSQQRAVESAKEQKRRIALAKLAQEKNYTKLKKVLKIKPEYINLMDAKIQTMLIGYYCLGDIAKVLQSGMSEEQMIRELEKSNFTYLSYFSLEQKNYLKEEGISPRLIEFLELHTQEINLKREQKEKLARLERERKQEEKEAMEDIEQERRASKRRRERQEKNDANAQRWRNMSNALTKTTNEMLNTIQHRSNQQQYASDAYNESISPSKKTTNYNNSYRTEKREINNNYNTKLANIKSKKMQLKNQQSNLNICYEIVGSWYVSEGKVSSGFTDKQFFSEKSVGAMVYSKRGEKAIINNFSSKSYTVTFPDKIIHKEFVYVVGKVKQNAACYGNNSINGQYTNIRSLHLAVDRDSNLRDKYTQGGNSISQ